MNDTQQRKRNLIGFAGCLGGLVAHLILGSIFQWGIINVYITSYYKLLDPTVTLEANSIAFPLMMLGISLAVTPGLYLSQKTHPLFISVVVTILQAGFVFASSYMTHIWGFFALFGILFGLVAGLNFMISVVECNKYFPGKKMYVNGFILIGSGLGPLIFGMFCYNFLNPQKLPNEKGYYYGTPKLQQIALKVPECVRWLSLFYLVIGLLSCLLLVGVCRQNRKVKTQKQNKKQTKEPQPIQIQLQLNDTTLNLQQNKANAIKNNFQIQVPTQENMSKVQQQQKLKIQSIKGEPSSYSQLIWTKVFWVGVCIFCFGSFGTFFVNVVYKTYAKLVISNDQFLTIIGVVSSIGNGFSRIIWNLIFNCTGYKFVIGLNLLLQIFTYATLRFAVNYPGFYLVLLFINGCCSGGNTSITPTFCQIVFGIKWGSKAFGIYLIWVSVANFLQYGFIVGVAPLITLDGVIYIFLGISIFTLILLIITNFQGPWKNSTEHLNYCYKYQKARQKIQK